MLRGELKKAVDEYINELVEHPQAAFWLGLDENFISTNLVQPDNGSTKRSFLRPLG